MEVASRGRVRALKESVVATVPRGSRVLEMGCGTGELASMLVDHGCTVEGFDLNRAMVRAARQRIAGQGLEDRFTVWRMGVDGMDRLRTGAYDWVVSTLVFSELSPDERRFALQHCARVLQPGGRLIVAAEVLPRTASGRALHRLVRAPALAATYLATGTGTRPVGDLAGEISAAGFTVEDERRSHGDAFVLVIAYRAEEEPAP